VKLERVSDEVLQRYSGDTTRISIYESYVQSMAQELIEYRRKYACPGGSRADKKDSREG
jgi:hypothetical protein